MWSLISIGIFVGGYAAGIVSKIAVAEYNAWRAPQRERKKERVDFLKIKSENKEIFNDLSYIFETYDKRHVNFIDNNNKGTKATYEDGRNWITVRGSIPYLENDLKTCGFISKIGESNTCIFNISFINLCKSS